MATSKSPIGSDAQSTATYNRPDRTSLRPNYIGRGTDIAVGQGRRGWTPRLVNWTQRAVPSSRVSLVRGIGVTHVSGADLRCTGKTRKEHRDDETHIETGDADSGRRCDIRAGKRPSPERSSRILRCATQPVCTLTRWPNWQAFGPTACAIPPASSRTEWICRERPRTHHHPGLARRLPMPMCCSTSAVCIRRRGCAICARPGPRFDRPTRRRLAPGISPSLAGTRLATRLN